MHKTTAKLHSETTHSEFTPTQIQIDAFARRMLPVIQEFFTDAQIQQEFVDWKKLQNTNQ